MLLGSRSFAQDTPGRGPEIERITVQELKAKIARNEPVTIIDVRGSASAASDSRIKGAIVVRSRRLEYRLAFPPLKDIPRDAEVVTYCGCANDEASVRAAQTMLAAGFKRVRALKGGWDAWLKAGGQLDSGSGPSDPHFR
jgi:rhodanese-related sulfurtransferase